MKFKHTLERTLPISIERYGVFAIIADDRDTDSSFFGRNDLMDFLSHHIRAFVRRFTTQKKYEKHR